MMEKTENKAEEFLEYLIKKDKSKSATVVALQGDLGSGKTTFTKIIGQLLGIKETIQSPTFVIQKKYETKDTLFKRLYHLDLYRIENPSEIQVLGLERIFEDKENLIFIEWPERAENLLPNDMINIRFEHVDENTRSITYDR